MISGSVWTVLLAALLTALATGLGAIPFFFVKTIERRWISLASALAAGLMLGASHGLIVDGASHDIGRLLIGVVLGLAFIATTRTLLARSSDLSMGALQGAEALTALMIIGVMTLHSFAEGIAVGVAFGACVGDLRSTELTFGWGIEPYRRVAPVELAAPCCFSLSRVFAFPRMHMVDMSHTDARLQQVSDYRAG